MMKKGAYILAVMLIVSTAIGSAQNPNRERLESYKIAFFTQRLKLTPDEAEKFWPLYNQYQEKKLKVQQERLVLNKKFNQEITTLSDEEMIAMGDKIVELEVLEAELSLTFHKQIKAVLPPAKVIRFYQAENQYKIQLLKELQERRPDRPNPGLR